MHACIAKQFFANNCSFDRFNLLTFDIAALGHTVNRASFLISYIKETMWTACLDYDLFLDRDGQAQF